MEQQANIAFTINGKDATAAPGETVLAVATRMGIEIPALCHHPGVEAYGTCRLCVVEVVWGKRSKIVTSCIYTPYAGDRIETDSERVRRTRKMVIELLLARCPEVDILKQLAVEYDVEPGRLPASVTGTWRDKCILCGLCVRVCAQGVRQNAIGYAGRGSERTVTPPFAGKAEGCIGCGACVFVCPTGALHVEDTATERVMVETETRLPLLACRTCGARFTTEAQFNLISARGLIPRKTLYTCPDCRRAETRSRAETLLAVPAAAISTAKG